MAQLGRTLAHTWRAALFVVDGFGRLKRAGLGTRLSLLLLEQFGLLSFSRLSQTFECIIERYYLLIYELLLNFFLE